MVDEFEEVEYEDERDEDNLLDDLEEEVYDDEIDPAEEGFVRGYEEDEDDSFDDDR